MRLYVIVHVSFSSVSPSPTFALLNSSRMPPSLNIISLRRKRHPCGIQNDESCLQWYHIGMNLEEGITITSPLVAYVPEATIWPIMTTGFVLACDIRLIASSLRALFVSGRRRQHSTTVKSSSSSHTGCCGCGRCSGIVKLRLDLKGGIFRLIC